MKKEMTFELAIKKLGNIVDRLEEGNISLDESLKLFEEGVNLSGFCSKKIEQAKSRVEILLKDSDGNLKKRAFKMNEDESPEETS